MPFEDKGLRIFQAGRENDERAAAAKNGGVATLLTASPRIALPLAASIQKLNSGKITAPNRSGALP
jgi:hypothetical protein